MDLEATRLQVCRDPVAVRNEVNGSLGVHLGMGALSTTIYLWYVRESRWLGCTSATLKREGELSGLMRTLLSGDVLAQS